MKKNYLTLLSESYSLTISERVDLIVDLLNSLTEKQQILMLTGIFTKCKKSVVSTAKSLARMKASLDSYKGNPLLSDYNLSDLANKLIKQLED